MKRFACFLLAICFMTGLLSGVSFAAFAEEAVKLQEVSLDFSLPADGAVLPDTFTVPEGFVIELFTWEIYREGEWQTLEQAGLSYSDLQTYKLRVQLVCAEGYCIDFAAFPSGYMPASINGEAAKAAFFGEPDNQKTTHWKGVALETILYGNAVPMVENLDISGIPVNTGDQFDASMIRVNDSHVTIQDCQINVDGEAAQSFQLGHGWYNIHIELSVADNYVLNPQQITVNGQPVSECGWEVAYGFEVGDGWISLSCEREPEAYIDGVTLSGAPTSISAGSPISAPQMAVKWSTNATVSISKVQWVDASYAPVDGNFVQGNMYYLAITLQTDGDMPFRDFFNLELLDKEEAYYTVGLATAVKGSTAIAYIPYSNLASVDQIQIQLSKPVAGEAPQQPVTEQGALFVIESYQWTDLADMSVVTVFAEGHRYQLDMQIRPLEGYQLKIGATVFVNGEQVYTVTDSLEECISVQFSLAKQVEQVEILVKEPSDHAVPAAPSLVDPSIGAVQHQWINAQTGKPATEFIPGNRYRLELVIQPADGCVFTESTEFAVNGKKVAAELKEDQANIVLTYDLVQTLTQVQLQGVPGNVNPGEIGLLPTVTAEDESITIAQISWLNEDWEPFDGPFELGNVYYLAITLQTDPLTCFAPTLQAMAGEKKTEAVSDDGASAVVYFRFSLLPQVDVSEITLELPHLGAAPSSPVIPEGAPYSILSFVWKERATGAEVTVFEEGHIYTLTVELAPVEGMEFGQLSLLLNGESVEMDALNREYAAFTVEYSFRRTIERVDLFAPDLTVGAEVKPSDIVVLTDGVMLQSGNWVNALTFEELSGIVSKAHYMLRFAVNALEEFEFAEMVQFYLNGQLLTDYHAGPNSATGSVSYDLRDVIDDIQISGMPQISIGGSTASITMGIPEGAPYSVQANWLLYGGDYQFAGPGAYFEDGKVYYLEILVKPAAGYRIAENATILVDGMEFTGITMTGDTGIWLYKQYNCGLQVIDRVDLTVTVPVAGMQPSSVKLPEGVSVALKDFSWAYCESGEFADAVDLLDGDIFEAGYYYMISGSLVAEKGYVFAENLTITVNGIPSNIDLGDLGVINLGDTAFLGHSFGLLQQSVQEPDPTGDSIGIVIALLTCSGGAWLTLKKRR